MTSIKIDPYLNTDAGTMSPFEHGEVFVLDDGGEVDLDLGNYERFLNVRLTRDHNITTGKVYNQVIRRERRGDYLGKTVQVVPHVTDAIQDWIERVAQIPTDEREDAPTPQVCLIEVGGTVGDIESSIFLEALRQFQFRVGTDNFALVHVSLVPVLGSVGEQKTKPTQHSVKELRSLGLSPNLIVCRSDAELAIETRNKLALFCHVAPANVIAVHNVSNIYQVPSLLARQHVSEILCGVLKLEPPFPSPQLERWQMMADRVDNPRERPVKIAIVGKYTGLQDAYLSVVRSLHHSGIQCDRRVDIEWIEASLLEHDGGPGKKPPASPEARDDAWSRLRSVNGVIVPGGFGDRGFEGKIRAVRHCRENKIPFLGICLGYQAAVVEIARHVLGLEGCTSEEFNPHADHLAVVYMPEFNTGDMGGTMRLGIRVTSILPLPDGRHSLSQDIYGGCKAIAERHRHRYEVNPALVPRFESEASLFFTGKDSDGKGNRMEIAELDREIHPYFWCCQYHPEFQTFPHSPSPPFWGLVQAAAGKLKEVLPFPFDHERGIVPAGSGPPARAGTPPGTPSRSPFPSPFGRSTSGSGLVPTANAASTATVAIGVKRRTLEEVDVTLPNTVASSAKASGAPSAVSPTGSPVRLGGSPSKAAAA